MKKPLIIQNMVKRQIGISELLEKLRDDDPFRCYDSDVAERLKVAASINSPLLMLFGFALCIAMISYFIIRVIIEIRYLSRSLSA